MWRKWLILCLCCGSFPGWQHRQFEAAEYVQRCWIWFVVDLFFFVFFYSQWMQLWPSVLWEKWWLCITLLHGRQVYEHSVFGSCFSGILLGPTGSLCCVQRSIHIYFCHDICDIISWLLYINSLCTMQWIHTSIFCNQNTWSPTWETLECCERKEQQRERENWRGENNWFLQG